MTTKRIVIGAALGFVMAVTVGRVAAFDTQRDGTFKTPYNATISGTATTMPIDAIRPGDGVRASWGHLLPRLATWVR